MAGGTERPPRDSEQRALAMSEKQRQQQKQKRQEGKTKTFGLYVSLDNADTVIEGAPGSPIGWANLGVTDTAT
jgi:hypothetical protein